MMKLKYMLMLLLIFYSVSCNTVRHDETKIKGKGKDLVQKLEVYLEGNIREAKVHSCPNYDSKNLFEYYRQEISKFSLDQALVELNQWNDKLSLNDSKDTIALIFFYPAVGFDPEQGYVTEYYIYGESLEKGVVGESNNKVSRFKTSRLAQSAIEERLKTYENYSNGCESGLLAISYLSPNLEFRRCHIALGITIFN